MKGYEAAKVKLDYTIDQIKSMGFTLEQIDQMYNEIMNDIAVELVE